MSKREVKIFHDESGRKVGEVELLNGKPDGKERVSAVDGVLTLEAEMENSEYHGNYTSWWNNGNKKEEGRYCRGIAPSDARTSRGWPQLLYGTRNKMKLELSAEAIAEMSRTMPTAFEHCVGVLRYSFRPNVEEHYDRSSDSIVISYTESADSTLGGSWDLDWRDRESVPEKRIMRAGEHELIICGATSPTATEMYIHFEENRFHVKCR